ncbi:MAG: UMP kinase [Conexivisphaera sp.]
MDRFAVVKVSGAVFDLQGRGSETVRRVAEQLRAARELGLRVVAVAGGGSIARLYIRAARELGASEAALDELGILITRANAELLVAALGAAAYPSVPRTLEELLAASASNRDVIIMGGLQPGQSTNAVAALAAESLGAVMLVNATDVDGVYTEDPRKNPKAVRLEAVGVRELVRLLSDSEHRAGTYELLDHVSLRILERSRIPAVVTSYERILDALRGEAVGTRITYDERGGQGI